jgi:hypothetical protein
VYFAIMLEDFTCRSIGRDIATNITELTAEAVSVIVNLVAGLISLPGISLARYTAVHRLRTLLAFSLRRTAALAELNDPINYRDFEQKVYFGLFYLHNDTLWKGADSREEILGRLALASLPLLMSDPSVWESCAKP